MLLHVALFLGRPAPHFRTCTLVTCDPKKVVEPTCLWPEDMGGGTRRQCNIGALNGTDLLSQ
jgi:hypothetical protein